MRSGDGLAAPEPAVSTMPAQGRMLPGSEPGRTLGPASAAGVSATETCASTGQLDRVKGIDGYASCAGLSRPDGKPRLRPRRSAGAHRPVARARSIGREFGRSSKRRKIAPAPTAVAAFEHARWISTTCAARRDSRCPKPFSGHTRSPSMTCAWRSRNATSSARTATE